MNAYRFQQLAVVLRHETKNVDIFPICCNNDHEISAVIVYYFFKST